VSYPSTRVRPLRVLLLVPALLAPLQARAQNIFSEGGEEFSFAGVTFPSVVDSFAVLRVTRYPQRELGVVLHYSSPLDRSLRFDLYVYPVNPGDSTALGNERAEVEFERSLMGLTGYAEQNPSRLQVLVDERGPVTVITASGQALEGHRASAGATEAGVAHRSLLYVFKMGTFYLKYRLSYAAAIEERIHPRVDAFLAESLDRTRLGAR